MRVKAVPFIVLAIALALATAAMAQVNMQGAQGQPASPPAGKGQWRHKGGHSAADRLNRLDQKVGLTADQKAKIGPIFEDQQKQAEAIRNDASLSGDQKMAKMKALRQSTRSQVEQLLTPEQRSKLGAEHKGKHGKGRMGANPERRMDMLSKRLNLTDDQKAKLSPMLENEHSQMQAVWQDSSLTPEQKKDKARQIRSDTHKQVLSLLTPEQQKQLREGWQRHKHGESTPES